MRAKETRKLSTVRLILAAIKEKDIELRTTDGGDRDDDAMITDILSDAEIKAACEAVVADLGAEGLKDIGRCMAALKEKYAGQMDFAKASVTIKGMLS